MTQQSWPPLPLMQTVTGGSTPTPYPLTQHHLALVTRDIGDTGALGTHGQNRSVCPGPPELSAAFDGRKVAAALGTAGRPAE